MINKSSLRHFVAIDLYDCPFSSWETIVNEPGPLADDALVAKQTRHCVIYLCARVTAPRLNPKMTKSCACVGCTNRFKKGSSITFHILPSKETRNYCHERWVQAMRSTSLVALQVQSFRAARLGGTDQELD